MIIKEENCLYFSNNAVDVLEKIPQGVWALAHNENKGYYLVKQDDFEVSGKLYGDYQEVAERYVNTFFQRKKCVGILLSGRSGSGKTLLAKLTCNLLALPVILISEEYSGTDFQKFISSIDQEIVIFIDEFEKIYDTHEKQNTFLPILDGVFTKKRMFLFTSNSHEINKFILNRPSRVLYHKKFDGLSDTEVEEIVEDLLDDKSNASELIELAKALGDISYDGVMSIIEEMNLYNASAREVIKHLNIKVEHATYNVVLLIKGKRFTSTIHTHPLSAEQYDVYYREKESEASNWYARSSFTVKLHKFDIEFGEGGQITMRDVDEQVTLVFTKLKEYKFEI